MNMLLRLKCSLYAEATLHVFNINLRFALREQCKALNLKVKFFFVLKKKKDFDVKS